MTEAASLETWEDASVESWRERWRLPEVIVLGEASSSNDVVRAHAAAGAHAGMLVIAEHQTAGRGNKGRTWIDQPGASLLLSFLLRPAPAVDATAAGTIPLRVGLAIATALRDSTGIDANLKWPNDVVVTGAGKVAGILCEASTAGNETVVVAGVGINIRQRPEDWPADLRGSAASVESITRRRADRGTIMDAVTREMRPLFTRSLTTLDDAERQAYAAFDSLYGHEVMTLAADPVRGIAAGITADGALLIDTADGTRRVTSATVRVVGNTVRNVDNTARGTQR